MNLTQILINSLVRASELGLIAMGVTLVFSLLRFANFAHGELALIGAYLAYALSAAGLDLWLAIPLGAVATGFIAVAIDKALFARVRTAPGLVLLVASMGLSLFLKNVVGAIWGTKSYSFEGSLARSFSFAGGFVTSTQVIILVVSVIAMLCFHLLLSHTRLGRAMRALADDSELARARGIRVEAIISRVWFIVGSYAALGGALIGLETVISLELGYSVILPAFAAAVLGGIGSVHGAMLGALIIGLAENIVLAIDWSFLPATSGPLYIDTGYKLAVAFLVMVAVLILRPRGLFQGTSGD